MIYKHFFRSFSIVLLIIYAIRSYIGTLHQQESNTNETQVLKNHFRSKSYNDSHVYYNSTTIINDDKVFNLYWVDLINHKRADRIGYLSDFYQKGDTFNLRFLFPFYGRLVNEIIVSNGGFLFFGGMNLYSWIAHSQYIAPLMADFYYGAQNDSHIYIKKNDTSFIVSWLNVPLRNKTEVGKFSFQVILYSNGNIVFVYKNVPINIDKIHQLSNHSVKVGLSDAYIEDKQKYKNMKNVTITEYNGIMINQEEISNKTVIILTPFSKCMERKNCTSCIEKDINIQCYWCENQCFSVMDPQKSCSNMILNPEDKCAAEILIPSQIPQRKSFFISICALSVIMTIVWVLYAYFYSFTPAGRVIIGSLLQPRGCSKSEDREETADIINMK